MAQVNGLGLSFLAASTDAELEAAFATAVERHIDALVISDQPFFTARHSCCCICSRLLLAHSVALNPFCQGLLIEGEADTNAAAR